MRSVLNSLEQKLSIELCHLIYELWYKKNSETANGTYKAQVKVRIIINLNIKGEWKAVTQFLKSRSYEST